MTDNQIQRLLREWLECSTLDLFERTLVQQLLNAIGNSRDHWGAVAQTYINLYEPILRAAFTKAQFQGLCRRKPTA